MTKPISHQPWLPLVLASAISLTGCSANSDNKVGGNEQDKPKATAPSAVSSASPASAYEALAAAGEPYEAITEQAFTADAATFAKLVAQAQAANDSIREIVPAAQIAVLDERLAAVQQAIAKGQPSDIALSAVEGYRLVVSQFPADAPVPAAVSLLDYAGFRIQADLKSSPPKWSDAREASKLAGQLWSGIDSKVTDINLKKAFAASLQAIDDAITAKDRSAAEKAAVRELDLVDRLETFFSAN